MLWDIKPHREMHWGYRFGEPFIELTGELSSETFFRFREEVSADERTSLREAELTVELNIGGHQEWRKYAENKLWEPNKENRVFSSEGEKTTGGLIYFPSPAGDAGKGSLFVKAYLEKDMFFDVRNCFKELNNHPDNASSVLIRLSTHELYKSAHLMEDFMDFTKKSDFFENQHILHFDYPISIQFRSPFGSNDLIG